MDATPTSVVGIDPGPKTSGFVWFDGVNVIESSPAAPNDHLCALLGTAAFKPPAAVVIERVQFYGKLMGADVFDTLWWGGRFYEAALQRGGYLVHRVYWNEVKRQFVERARTDDAGKRKKITEADVRLGVLKRFGGEQAAKGTKAAPGPCRGVTSHAWSALALAVYWWDRSSSAGLVPYMADRAALVPREEGFDF
jgi:hypothetical protein